MTRTFAADNSIWNSHIFANNDYNDNQQYISYCINLNLLNFMSKHKYGDEKITKFFSEICILYKYINNICVDFSSNLFPSDF